MAHAIRPQRSAAIASGLDVLAAIWLVISPIVLSFVHYPAAISNNIILGLVIGALAIYRAINPARLAVLSWINVLLGVWVAVSPWVVGFRASTAATYSDFTVGIIIVIIASAGALATGPGEF